MTFKERLAAREPMFGMWLASGSTVNAEICASSGLDFLVLDGEHSPNDLLSLLAQLQAVAPYPIQAVLRPPIGDVVLIKQYLDLGATALLVPMVASAEQAEQLVAAVRYPPRGVRGVGAGLARSARWGRDTAYFDHADDGIALILQVESLEALDAIEDIAAVDGVDGIFVGPSDLAGSMGHLGHPEHPDVVARVEDAIQRIVATGKPAGVHASVEATARRDVELGASFVLVGADVSILTRETGRLAETYVKKD